MAPPDFDLPIAAIAAAITSRTRAVILNSPHNPTGRVVPLSELAGLAEVLRAASARLGRPIQVLSDEAYNRIVFDGRAFHSVAEVYSETFVVYTYGKTLLAPGERMGYIAIPPTMGERERVRRAIGLAQWMTGFAYPNATLQRAIGDLEALSIDLPALQRRRDVMATALRAMGYALLVPEGTFYMMVRSPVADDGAFFERLAAHDTFVLPGSVVERPGWFRVSLTANDEMVARGLRGFAAALG
jgi:aspartate aminotransferase